MKAITDWINSHKVLMICIAVVLLVGQPLLVHWMFKTEARSAFWENTWEAGDLLGYIAGFEAFLGTVFLGIVAVRQNDKANELNERMLINEEKHQKYERQPAICLTRKNFSIQTLYSIFNHPGPVYSCDGIKHENGFPTKYWSKEYYFFTWEVQNISSRPIRVSKVSLRIENLENKRKLIFDSSTINFSSSIPYISSHSNLEMGFIIDTKELETRRILSGDMELEIRNEVDELITYTLLFFIVPTNDDDFSLVKSVENIIKSL